MRFYSAILGWVVLKASQVDCTCLCFATPVARDRELQKHVKTQNLLSPLTAFDVYVHRRHRRLNGVHLQTRCNVIHQLSRKSEKLTSFTRR